MSSEIACSGVLQRVHEASVAWNQEHDYWERSAALTGMLAWESPSGLEAARRWLDRAVATQDDRGYLSYGEPLALAGGHVGHYLPTAVLPASMALPLLRLAQRDDNADWLKAVDRQMNAVMQAPRTERGGFSGRADRPELWVDMTYMICALLAEYGHHRKDGSYVDEAYHQLLVHADHLVDPRARLSRHTWVETPNHFSQSTFWSRGNGWITCAAADLLEVAPDHPSAGAARQLLADVLDAVARHQLGSGFLRNVLDDPLDRVEASGTLMFAYAAAKAHRLGVVDEEYVARALRALTIVAGGCVDASGVVLDVVVPPGGPGVPYGTAAYAQGFFLLACYELRNELGLDAGVLDGK